MSCAAIQPPDLAADPFRVLGVAREFDIDLKAAEARFRELSRSVHPDRFATADPRSRRFSMQRSVQLNEAWKTMKDPVRRAESLLSFDGWEVGAESGASRPGQPAAAREPIPVRPALLGEVIELREELSDARAAGDPDRVRRLAREVQGRLDAALARVATGFTAAQSSPDPTRALEDVVQELIAIRYWRRFLDEVDLHEEAELARHGGGTQAASGASEKGSSLA